MDSAKPAATLPPVPPTAIPAMPPSRLPVKAAPILSKFHLNPDEQRILAVATEANAGLARVFDQVNRLAATKLALEALTPEERATYTAVDGAPCDAALDALTKLTALLKQFAK